VKRTELNAARRVPHDVVLLNASISSPSHIRLNVPIMLVSSHRSPRINIFTYTYSALYCFNKYNVALSRFVKRDGSLQKKIRRFRETRCHAIIVTQNRGTALSVALVF